MKISRRTFVRDGVTAFTVSFAAPAFLSDIARAQGATSPYILLRHVMPNAMAPIIVQASLGVGRAILAEAGLSYLGLGTQPPIPSWGKMLQEAQGHRRTPWRRRFVSALIASFISQTYCQGKRGGETA